MLFKDLKLEKRKILRFCEMICVEMVLQKTLQYSASSLTANDTATGISNITVSLFFVWEEFTLYLIDS